MRRLITLLILLVISSCQADKSTIRQQQDNFLTTVKKSTQQSEANVDENTEPEGEPEDSDRFRDNYINEGEDKVSAEEEEWLKDAQKLTQNFTTFPSSSDINSHLSTTLEGPVGGCLNFYTTQDGKKIVSSPAVRGARKVYATLFQSCNVFDKVITGSTPDLRGVTSYKAGDHRIRKITNQSTYNNSHIVLNSLDDKTNYPGPNCVDARNQPPVYGYGSRKAPNSKGEINLFSRGGGVSSSSKDASGIDCSSFISVALATQGLKVSKNSPPYVPFTTASLHESIKSSNSCMNNVKFSEDSSIVPGDIINVASSHIIMIDEVGDDPLAIKKYAQRNECSKIKVSDFNFTYIHSGNVNNSYGPSRVHSSKHNGGQMFDNLRMSAMKSCMNIVKGQSGPVDSKSLNLNPRFDIVRHNSAEPSCISDKKVTLKNEECINGCYADFKETIE